MTERLAHAFAGTLLAILILLSPRGLSGQAPPPLRPATLHAELLLWPLSPQETASEEGGVGITPRGAMLRSFLIPGWGHAALGSYNRGGFYFLAEALSGWMLVKTGRSLRSAKGRRDLIEEEVEARLRAAGIVDPDSIAPIVDEDPAVEEARGLVDIRSQQMEDWVAVSLFIVFLSGIDSFVSAHLADFPAPLSIEAVPGKRSELRFSVRLGRGGA